MDTHIDVNQILIVGHIFRRPILRHTRNGTPFLKLRIKTINSFTGDGGKPTVMESNHNAIIWGQKGVWLHSQVTKGSRVLIAGNLQNSSYERDAQVYWSTQINAELCSCLDLAPSTQRTLTEHDPNEFFHPHVNQ